MINMRAWSVPSTEEVPKINIDPGKDADYIRSLSMTLQALRLFSHLTSIKKGFTSVLGPLPARIFIILQIF